MKGQAVEILGYRFLHTKSEGEETFTGVVPSRKAEEFVLLAEEIGLAYIDSCPAKTPGWTRIVFVEAIQ